MHCFRLALCLQIIVHVFGVKDASDIQQNLQPNSSETTPPVQTPAGKNETFNCSNLNPSFMATITCFFPVKNVANLRFSKTGGLIISERWILGKAVFLSHLCKSYLPEGCLVGSPKPGNKCQKIITHENFKDTTYYDLALLSVETALPAGVVPWPKTRTFLKPLDEIVFYGQEISSGAPSRRCTTAGVVQFELCSNKSVICAWPLNVNVAMDICSEEYSGGLAVSNNIVVGILSTNEPSLPLCLEKTYSKPSDLNLSFIKIDDYYTFIHNVTNITVPFESSPALRIKSTTTEESSSLRTRFSERTRTWTEGTITPTEPLTTVYTTTTTTRSTKKTLPSCRKQEKPSIFVQMFCNVISSAGTGHRYFHAEGLTLSEHWVLGPASQLQICKKFLNESKGCLIGSINLGKKCKRIILHEKFDKVSYHNNIALVETKEYLTFPEIGGVPWPGRKGFSDTCKELSFYGYVHMFTMDDLVKCVTLEIADCSRSRHYIENEAVLCGWNFDDEVLQISVCMGDFQMGLAMCEDFVVGIFSHVVNETTSSTCSQPPEISFVLTKIKDYYGFIHEKTGLEVPFQSSPAKDEGLGRRARYGTTPGTTSSADKLNATRWLLLLGSLLLLMLL